MLIGEILRTQFTKIDSSATLPEICVIFASRHISSAPVHKNDQFIGVISDLDIIGAIEKKKLNGVWVKGKGAPSELLGSINAGSIARKPKFTLTSQDRLADALPKILRRDIDLVPVVDSDGRLEGIIRGSDVMAVLLKEFAKLEITSAVPAQGEAGGPSMDTVIDSVLACISRKGEIRFSALAKETSLPRDTLEKIVRSLESHHLIIINYPFFGEMSMKVRAHE